MKHPKAPLGNNFRPPQPLHYRPVRTNIDFNVKSKIAVSILHFKTAFFQVNFVLDDIPNQFHQGLLERLNIRVSVINPNIFRRKINAKKETGSTHHKNSVKFRGVLNSIKIPPNIRRLNEPLSKLMRTWQIFQIHKWTLWNRIVSSECNQFQKFTFIYFCQ